MRDSGVAPRRPEMRETQESFRSDNKGVKLYNQTVNSLKKDQDHMTKSLRNTSCDFTQTKREEGKPDDYGKTSLKIPL